VGIVANNGGIPQFLSGAITLDTVTVPLNGTTNDLDPSGGRLVSLIYLEPNAALNLAGIAGGIKNRELRLVNTKPYVVTLQSNTGSAAGNRFIFGADIALAQNGVVDLIWNDTANGWLLINNSSASGSGALLTPSAPQNVAAFAKNASIKLSWLPSAFGSPTSYSVTLSPGGATVTTTGLTVTITGLTNGTTYTATITPINAAGNGTAATAQVVTPSSAAASLSAITSADLFAWYAADQLPSPPSNGNPLITGSGGTGLLLNDASGNGWGISAGSTNKPVMVTSWLNSKPGMNWVGANHCRLNFPFTLAQLGSVFSFWVVIINTSTPGRIISNNIGAPASLGQTFEVDNFGPAFRQLGFVNISSSVITTGTAYMLTCTYGNTPDGHEGFAYVNGVKQTLSGGQLTAKQACANLLTMGAQANDSNWLDGVIGDMGILRGAWSDADRHTIESIIGTTKYGLSMSVQ